MIKCLFFCLSVTKNDHFLKRSVCLFVLFSLPQKVCVSVKKKEHFSRRFLLNPLKPHLNSLNSPRRLCASPKIITSSRGSVGAPHETQKS